jgi:D-alanyl-D-alanine carboxypeptidase
MAGEKRTKGLPPAAVASILVCAALVGVVPAASAHVDAPTVTALHAFIGDPLFGLDAPAGTLFGILPDDQTAEASTTKLMTLDLTVHALDDGVVSLDDPVMINAFEAGIGGSSMDDINGTPLETGEVVSLELLIRGMMYPSGNNAAFAIARHVAQAYLGPAADFLDFVDMMNDHAASLGLTDTSFANPNGFDNPGHYTTARELSMIIEHGIHQQYFQEVIGLQGTFTGLSQGPNGLKTYMWNWGFLYPGWEGAKGGSTPNCDGPNSGCMAMSAERIGRRVVLAFMQGLPWTEEPGMFDYAFGQIFHPDPRGSSVTVGGATRHDLTCFSSNRCLTVALPPSGPVEVASWAPDVDNSTIGVLDEEPLPGSVPPKGKGKGQGPEGDVALARLPSGAIVLADRKGSSVELSRWSMDGGGSLSLLGSGVKLGPAATMDLQPVHADMLLSAVTDPGGALVLKSWRLDGSSLEHLDTYRDGSRAYSEVAAAGPLSADLSNGHRAVTAAIAPGQLVHDVWAVDETTGAISRLGHLVEQGNRDRVEISPFLVDAVDGELFPPVHYATAFRIGGQAAIRFYRIDASGAPVAAGLAATTSPVEGIDVAPLGTGGVLAALRGVDGSVELVAWEALRLANFIIPDQVSQHETADAGSLDLASVPSTHAEGDYVTGVTDPVSGELRLRGYRSGDRPY